MTKRQQFLAGIAARARAAAGWFLVVIVLAFAALARSMSPTLLNWLHFAIGIAAAIGLTRVWNLLDDVRELQRQEAPTSVSPPTPAPPPPTVPFPQDTNRYGQ